MTLNSEGLEKALEKAEQQAAKHGDNVTCSSLNIGYDEARLILSAARSYLSAPSPVDGLEVVAEIEGLIDAYWGLAFMEGREGRDTDTPEDAAQKTRAAISGRLATLSQASSVIAGLKEEVARLTKERDAAIGWPPRADITHYCTDCEMVAVPHDGRCGCGSGRVVAIRPLLPRISSLEEENKTLREELSDAEHALMVVQVAIDEDKTALSDTLWTPERFSAAETLLDFVGRYRANIAARQALGDHNG